MISQIREFLWTCSLYNRCPRCKGGISAEGYASDDFDGGVHHYCKKCGWNMYPEQMRGIAEKISCGVD
jgi:hypothetical protein